MANYAILGVYPTKELAETAAKQCCEELNEPLIAVKILPCHTLLEFDDQPVQMIYDQAKLSNLQSKLQDLRQKEAQKRQQLEDLMCEPIESQRVEGSKAHVAQLIYRLYVNESQQRKSSKSAEQAQQQYLQQLDKLNEILKAHPEVKDQWASHIRHYLRQLDQEEIADKMQECFNRHFTYNRRTTLL